MPALRQIMRFFFLSRQRRNQDGEGGAGHRRLARHRQGNSGSFCARGLSGGGKLLPVEGADRTVFRTDGAGRLRGHSGAGGCFRPGAGGANGADGAAAVWTHRCAGLQRRDCAAGASDRFFPRGLAADDVGQPGRDLLLLPVGAARHDPAAERLHHHHLLDLGHHRRLLRGALFGGQGGDHRADQGAGQGGRPLRHPGQLHRPGSDRHRDERESNP